jgi:aldose 1-epimerase
VTLTVHERAAGSLRSAPVWAWELSNSAGVRVEILALGALLRSVRVPVPRGEPLEVSLGLPTLTDYAELNPAPCPEVPHGRGLYFGAIVGRYANRIADGRFGLGPETYAVPVNNGPNALHGGTVGFDQAVWSTLDVRRQSGSVGVVLEHVSPSGDMGFPGRLRTEAGWSLDEESRLTLTLRATTDAPTVVNLTNHAYWNLAGPGRDIGGHLLWIDADAFTPIDETLIPTGELRAVAGTPFDFRTPTTVSARIDGDDPQIRRAGGYDHNWVLRGDHSALRVAATLVEPASGRGLRLHTTQPGLQVYSGNFLDGTVMGPHGQPWGHRQGIALEAQHFPDSPNQTTFPPTTLQPGVVFEETIVFEFFGLP